MLSRAMAATSVAATLLPRRARHAMTRRALRSSPAAAAAERPSPSLARPADLALATAAASFLAPGARAPSRLRHLVVAAAKIPAKPKAQYSTKRLRASDEFVAEEEDEDYDPYVHMGRPNREALKRLMTEYRNLTKALCALPKSSIAKINMPEEVREEVYATIKISSNIARKRAEGRVAKLIRGLDDAEALPIQTAVENLQNGIGLLTVEPEVEATAMAWRASLLAGDDKTQKEVFGLMSPEREWSFTRQELSQLVTRARKEKADAEAAREAERAAKEAAEATAIVMPDGTTVPTAVAPPTGKKKKGGAGKSQKTLLKHLRSIAEWRSQRG